VPVEAHDPGIRITEYTTYGRSRAKTYEQYPSERRRCRFPDSGTAQRAKIERTSKLKKAAIHRLSPRLKTTHSRLWLGKLSV
jgi:hypothetical protein